MSFKVGQLLDFNSKNAQQIVQEYVFIKALIHKHKYYPSFYKNSLFYDQTDGVMPLSLFHLITDIFTV